MPISLRFRYLDKVSFGLINVSATPGGHTATLSGGLDCY